MLRRGHVASFSGGFPVGSIVCRELVLPTGRSAGSVGKGRYGGTSWEQVASFDVTLCWRAWRCDGTQMVVPKFSAFAPFSEKMDYDFACGCCVRKSKCSVQFFALPIYTRVVLGEKETSCGQASSCQICCRQSSSYYKGMSFILVLGMTHNIPTMLCRKREFRTEKGSAPEGTLYSNG